jgi:hypothetical protein
VALIALLALVWGSLVSVFWYLRVVDRIWPVQTAKPG